MYKLRTASGAFLLSVSSFCVLAGVAVAQTAPSAPPGCVWDSFTGNDWVLWCINSQRHTYDTGRRIPLNGGAEYTVTVAPPPAPIIQPPPGTVVKRTPGPGCLPYSTYATNCQTSEEFRKASGMPTVEEDRIRAQKEQEEQRAADAALATDLATPVPSNDPARKCAYLNSHQITVQERVMGQLENVHHSANGMENSCNFSVQFKVSAGGRLRWVPVEAGQWQQFDDRDQWTGQVRRAN
jgi:hypothetical protein